MTDGGEQFDLLFTIDDLRFYSLLGGASPTLRLINDSATRTAAVSIGDLLRQTDAGFRLKPDLRLRD